MNLLIEKTTTNKPLDIFIRLIHKIKLKGMYSTYIYISNQMPKIFIFFIKVPSFTYGGQHSFNTLPPNYFRAATALSTDIDFDKKNNGKFKVGAHVKKTKYERLFANGYVPN